MSKMIHNNKSNDNNMTSDISDKYITSEITLRPQSIPKYKIMSKKTQPNNTDRIGKTSYKTILKSKTKEGNPQILPH